MADDTVVIQLTLDDSQVKKVTKALPGVFDDAGDKAGTSFAAKFNNKVKSGLSNLNSSIGGMLTNTIKLTAAATALGAAFTLKKAISESAEFEKSLRGLNSIARSVGVDTNALKDTIQDLEAEGLVPLSNITESFKNLLRSTNGDLALSTKAFKSFRDSAVNNRESQFSLGEAIATTTRGIKSQVSTNTDAIGVSDNLSQVNARYAASIGTTVGKLTEQQKQLGSVVGLMKAANVSTGDFAASLDTFDGVVGAVNSEYTKFLRQLGQFVTQSPAIKAVLKTIGTEFNSFNKVFKDFANNGGIKQVTLAVIDFGEDMVNYVLKPLSFAADAFDIFRKAGALAVQAVVANVAELGAIVAQVFNALGIDNAFLDGIKTTADVSKAALAQMAVDLNESVESAFGTENIDKVLNFTSAIRDSVAAVTEVAATTANSIAPATQAAEKSFISLAGTAKGSGKAISASIKNSMVQTATAGIQALTTALVTGEGSFKAFGSAIAGILGSMATQLGQTLLLTGIGMSALMDLTGGKAIAAGIGLIALGSILSSFSGGGGSTASTSSTSSDPNSISTVDDSIISDEPEERAEASTSVVVNIQGDILDSDESGSRIMQIINDTYDKSGVVLNSGVVA